MAKAGLDYHDRGQMLVSRAFMKAGMEVIYLDTGNIPEEIVNAALQEDVDVLGISSMTAAHMVHVKKIMHLLKENNRENILVLLGGIIPKQDIPLLKEMGVAEVFGPSSSVIDPVKITPLAGGFPISSIVFSSRASSVRSAVSACEGTRSPLCFPISPDIFLLYTYFPSKAAHD